MNLPDKPSELIRLAISDLEKIEDDPRYTVDMNYWHRVNKHNNNVCHVCLAGSVMVKSLDLNSTNTHSPYSEEFSQNKMKLVSLDLFRRGEIRTALSYMNTTPHSTIRDVRLCDLIAYQDNPHLFKKTMLELALELEGHGL